MTKDQQQKYIQGQRQAWLSMLKNCLKELDFDDLEGKAWQVQWALEREMIVQKLREVCHHFGDNDWPENLNLAHVIENHLNRHLRS